MFEKRTFQHDGKDYEIRISSDGCTIRIRTFLNGKPANGYIYSVDLLTQVDAKITGALCNPAEELIKTAESDVKMESGKNISLQFLLCPMEVPNPALKPTRLRRSAYLSR